MIRKRIINNIFLTTFFIFILFVVISFTNNDNIVNIKDNYYDKASYIYLMNKDNYLVSSNILVSGDFNNDIYTIIDNLKNDYYHYNGLRGILPSSVKINNFNIKDNILYIDFNSELFNVSDEFKERVIECLVYTFCKDNIKGIKISINGNDIREYNNILDKSFGINKEYNINRINDIKKVILYYYLDDFSFVPVTKYVNDTSDEIDIIINNLSSSYLYNTNLYSYLNDKIRVDNYDINDDIISLSFSNIIDIDSKLLEKVIYSVSMSIFDSIDVNTVIFTTNDKIFAIKVK